MVWTSPRTWVAGEKPTATTFNTHVRDNFKAIGDPWTSYTPTLSNVTLGTGGTVVGAYVQAGKLVLGRVIITLGTGGSFTGAAMFTLPVSPLITTDLMPLGTVMMLDTSASVSFDAVCRWATATSNVAIQYHLGTVAASIVNATTPWTWAVGDKLFAQFAYEAA